MGRIIDFVLPGQAAVSLSLEAEQSFRDDQPAPVRLPALEGRVSLGGPLAVPITAKSYPGTAELAAFLAGAGKLFNYYLLTLALTFESGPGDPPLEGASVALTLSATGTGPEPVAWSMAPQRIVSSEHTSTSVKLGPELKIEKSVAVSPGSFTRTRELDREEVFVQSFGELRSDPRWEFHRTKGGKELVGSHRLLMVVRGPHGVTLRVSTVVRAEVRHGTIMRRYRRELGPVLTDSGEF